MLLSLVVWVGGIVFFAFVVAPTLFSVLPTRQLAGAVVTRALTSLHWIGIVAAVVLLVSSFLVSSEHGKIARQVCVLLMLALTLASEFGIGRRMTVLRAEMGEIDGVAPADPRRIEFNRLHQWSTRLEGGVLLLGLATIFLIARE